MLMNDNVHDKKRKASFFEQLWSFRDMFARMIDSETIVRILGRLMSSLTITTIASLPLAQY